MGATVGPSSVNGPGSATGTGYPGNTLLVFGVRSVKVNSLHGGPCYAQKFSDSAVQKAKSATYQLLSGGPPDHK